MNQETLPASDPRGIASSGETQTTAAEGEIRLIDVLLVVARHRLLILGLPLVTAILTAVIVLLLPNVYTASAIVIPIQPSPGGNVGALLGQFSPLPFGDVLSNKNEALFVRVLQSRKIAERVIKKFELMSVYGTDSMHDTLEALQDHVSAKPDTKSGLITISVDDQHPTRAADMANYYVDQLIDVVRDLNLTEASRRRAFYEKQFSQAQQRLREAEAAMKAYQASTGVVSLDNQGGQTLNMIARLEAEITTKEIQLQVARTTVTDEHPQALALLEQLRGLRGKLDRLKDTENSTAEGSLGRFSAISTEYAQRWREMKYRESVVEILSKQFELARLDELREASAVQVLDRAETPQQPSKPKRKLVVLGATLLGGLLALLMAFVLESLRNARADPFQTDKWEEAGRHLRNPLIKCNKTTQPADGAPSA